MEPQTWILIGVSIVVTILGYLLRTKDAKLEKDIAAQEERLARDADAREVRLKKDLDLLFELHRNDSDRLQKLELDIAREYYVKRELDPKFDKIETALHEWFTALGGKIDTLSSALTEHIRKEDIGK